MPQKNFLLWLLLFLLIACGVNREETSSSELSKKKSRYCFKAPDGPYLFYNDDGTVRLLGSDEAGCPIDTTMDRIPDHYLLQVVSHNKRHRFGVSLHSFVVQPWLRKAPEKLLVLSDPHGDFESFHSVLKGNHVINDRYEWAYGENELMVIGDVFDRGNDVLPIFWLLYKLQYEASEAGGAVHFVIGNHESMILRNDLRYMERKYADIAHYFKMEYVRFFGADTELGRWIASGNTIQVIGDDLFVHAGLSRNFYDGDYEIPFVNEQIRKGIFLDKEDRNGLSEHSEFLFSSSSKREGGAGPLWYRGMVGRDGEAPELEEDILLALLKRYHVKRIIVGHTIFPEVSSFYNGKVIAVNVKNKENRDRLGSRGVLIENGKTFIVNDKGKMKVM